MNKYLPHLYVLPEDDANRQIANGFILNLNINTRRIQVLNEAGGWTNVLNDFKNAHAPNMLRYQDRFMVLLIDFDQQRDRWATAMAEIPESLKKRVFVLGTWSTPEDLRQQISKSYETIGKELATDCHRDSNHVWGHKLLAHNADELERLRECVKSFLFRAE